MIEKKPFYVELSVCSVVMAENVADAMRQAERHRSDIISDNELAIDCVIEIDSLESLYHLCPDWTAECAPHGSDGDTLGGILPEKPPFQDTKTLDLFAPA